MRVLLSVGVAVALSAALARSPARAAEGATPDYSGYQELLDEFLIVSAPAGAPMQTLFDYTKLFRTPDRAKRLANIRSQLLSESPAKFDDKTRMAWAINAYNYLVIELVTGNLFEGTQKLNKGGKRYYFAKRIATVQTIDLDGFTFFEGPVVDVDGVSYSLNAFERHFVFRDFKAAPGAKPPAGLDPRAHFALVCASKGCPPLMPRAYRADSLDQQLEWVTRNALASPSHLRFDDQAGRLEGSSIFDWYRGDFGGTEGAFAFLKKYAPAETRAAIEKRKIPWIATYILWDWGLNHPEGGNEKPWEKVAPPGN